LPPKEAGDSLETQGAGDANRLEIWEDWEDWEDWETWENSGKVEEGEADKMGNTIAIAIAIAIPMAIPIAIAIAIPMAIAIAIPIAITGWMRSGVSS